MVLLLVSMVVGVLTVVPGRAKPLAGGLQLVHPGGVRVPDHPALTRPHALRRARER